jgi:type III secretion system YscQ/HrcQ family protein
MTTASTWLKKITPVIFEALSLSDKGSIPPFKMKPFITSMHTSLGRDDLSITVDKQDFISAESFYKGLGSKTNFVPLCLHPLNGKIYFVMGSDSIKSLISTMNKSKEDPSFISIENEEVVKGLYTYFITEAIDSLMQLNMYPGLSLVISEGAMTELSALSLDITISLANRHFLARLLVPNKIYKAINEHFTFIPPTLENLDNIADVNVPFSIRTGSVTLPKNELTTIEEGDFIILHNTFYKPSEKKGSFQMLLGNFPLFQVKLAKDGIKVLDYLYFYNEENMNEDEIDSPFDEEDDDEFDLDDDYEDDDYEDDDVDENYSEEFIDKEDSFEENKSKFDPLEEEEQNEVGENPLLSPEKTNLSKVPLTIHMEIARFSLSLEELKKMSPGFKLPININPLHVNLVVSGKSIGTGEIIEVGDAIGVKVTELYM